MGVYVVVLGDGQSFFFFLRVEVCARWMDVAFAVGGENHSRAFVVESALTPSAAVSLASSTRPRPAIHSRPPRHPDR